MKKCQRPASHNFRETAVHSPFRFFGRLLDTLNIALCLYDGNDNALLWNSAFFKFFPEHAGHIHAGEHYSDNLRRFYKSRLDAGQLRDIERYVEEGVARHRAQSMPYMFQHRGLWLKVSSLPVPGVGRIRVWVQVPPPRPMELAATGKGCVAVEHETDRLDVALIEDIADGISVAGADHRIISVNEHFMLLYGLSDRKSVIGRSFAEVFAAIWTNAHAGTQEAEMQERLRSLEESIRFAGAPFEVPLPNSRWMRVVAHRTKDGSEYWIHTDISQLKLRQKELEVAEQRARESEKLYRLLADYSSDVIIGLDSAMCVRYVSPSITAMLGYRPDELADKPWAAVLHPAYPDSHESGGGESLSPATFRATGKDGKIVWLEKTISPVPEGETEDAIRYVFHLRNVTQRVEIERRLQLAYQEVERLASIDSLSGLANRRILDETLEREWRRMRREELPLSLLMIDIDHFKLLNDRFGHQTGDECIRLLGETMRSIVRRPGDLCARYGGEEFAVLLPNTEADQAYRIAEKIRVRAGTIGPRAGKDVQLSVSVGVATIVPSGDTPSGAMIVQQADSALYEAKRLGRNRVVCATTPTSDKVAAA
jgi:diguanylate cyclase (GGDEF)-like protein/PAS domain S-box-containing protein